MKYLAWLLILKIFSVCGYAQVEIIFHSSHAVGVTSEVAENGSYKQVASVGQPLASISSSGFFAAADFLVQSSVVDDIPPSIAFDPQQFSLVKDQNSSFDATVTDNFTVASVYLYYKPIAQPKFDSVALVSAGSNNYSLLIGANQFQEVYDQMGMEYYLKAFDSKNSARYPETGSLYKYLTTNNTLFPLSVFGPSVQKYRIVSIPFDNVNKSVLSVFEEFASLQGRRDYRIFHYMDEEYMELPYDLNSVERGKGYFLIIRDAININLEQQTAPSNNRNSPFEMNLNPGWNMIGNPYPIAISWNDVMMFNGEPAEVGGLKKYSGNWISENTLQPFEGAFVHLDGTQQLKIKIPFQGQTSANGRVARRFSNDINDRSGWRLSLEVKTDNLIANGFLGMKEDASLYADRYDDFNVPKFIEYAEIAFPHSEHQQGFFSQDIVPICEEFTWRFVVNSSNWSEGVLSWNNNTYRTGGKHLYLYDVESAQIIDMRIQNSYTYAGKGSNRFKVYFGDSDILEKIGPDEVIVEKPYPNPFTSSGSVLFQVRVPWSSAELRNPSLVIEDLLGRKVFDGNFNLTGSNTYSLSWSGMDLESRRTPAGVYVYTIKAGSIVDSGRVILKN